MTYKKLKAEHRALVRQRDEAEDGTAQEDAYWQSHAAFQGSLRKMLSDKRALQHLTKKQTWQVIRWCSSYRPAPLHTILADFGSLVDE